MYSYLHKRRLKILTKNIRCPTFFKPVTIKTEDAPALPGTILDAKAYAPNCTTRYISNLY